MGAENTFVSSNITRNEFVFQQISVQLYVPDDHQRDQKGEEEKIEKKEKGEEEERRRVIKREGEDIHQH